MMNELYNHLTPLTLTIRSAIDELYSTSLYRLEDIKIYKVTRLTKYLINFITDENEILPMLIHNPFIYLHNYHLNLLRNQ